ncbi:excalibur calcium-binding domain-containing protein [Streptomyces sp. NBC_01264]|uniref:excalibur calcium-binding domain-containing protein n=1 Tax=Streptomyces sp. NBC_01264 TaxID=2903804 RepID=UPI003D2FE54A
MGPTLVSPRRPREHPHSLVSVSKSPSISLNREGVGGGTILRGAGARQGPRVGSCAEAVPRRLILGGHLVFVKAVLPGPVEARGAYGDVPLPADHGQWAVCFQTPAAAAPVAGGTSVEISLVAPGIPCPAAAGASLRPPKGSSPVRTPVPSADPGHPKPKQPKSGPTPAPGPKDVSYRNCAEARAAGAAPIRRGQPGYGRYLDRDDDGIACDTWATRSRRGARAAAIFGLMPRQPSPPAVGRPQNRPFGTVLRAGPWHQQREHHGRARASVRRSPGWRAPRCSGRSPT